MSLQTVIVMVTECLGSRFTTRVVGPPEPHRPAVMVYVPGEVLRVTWGGCESCEGGREGKREGREGGREGGEERRRGGREGIRLLLQVSHEIC